MTGRLVSPTMIGREREARVVAATLDTALTGDVRHLLVAGEAGVGKSRLVADAIGAAEARGMLVLRGACVNIGESGVPYGPIVEALRELQRDLDPAILRDVVGHAGPDLARLLPSIDTGAVPDPTIQREWLQARLFEALLGLLRRLAARTPLLIVVEDLHWADPGTRETLTYLIRNLRTDPAVFLLTYRSDELHRRHPLRPWLAEIERSGRTERIELERLGSTETSELIAAILGAEPPRDLVDRVVERSDGNPFFVEELVMADGSPLERGLLPPTLREILLARIGALSDSAHAVVGVAAVAGRRVDHDLLALVSDTDEPTMIAALREAVGQQVLVSDASGGAEGYAFRHALMQEAAYEDLLPGDRGRLHRAFAQAVAERSPGSGAVAAAHWAELAHHWSAARNDRRAFDASIRAATAAVEALALADALRQYELALELWPGIPDAAELAGQDLASILDSAATIASLDGQVRRGATLREAAIAELDPEGDPVRAALFEERLGRARWLAGDTAGALRAYERVMAMVPADPPHPARARVLSGFGQLLMLIDRWDESVELLEEALVLARASGDRLVEAHALDTLGMDLVALGRSEEGFAATVAAHDIAIEVRNIDEIGRSNVNLANALLFSGEAERAAEVMRAGIAEARELGIASSYGCYMAHQGTLILFELGRWDEAAALVAETLTIQHLEAHADRYALSRWVPLLVATGDPTAGTRLDQLGRLLEGGPPEAQFLGNYLAARAEAQLWAGDPAAALAALSAGLASIAGTYLVWHPIRLARQGARAAADLAEQGRARRDPAVEQAAVAGWAEIDAILQPLLGRTRRMHHGSALAETEAEAAMIEAEVARLRGEPAVDAWSGVVRTWVDWRRPYHEAYGRWRLAEAHLAAGDRQAAADEASAAHRIATTLGARPLRRELESLATRARLSLRAGGDAPPAAARATRVPLPADPFGLTRREREVLGLLVSGRTNRQIAETLFVSESTAGVHVSNILGKLGVTTRTEAATTAVRLRLVAPDA